MIGIDYRKGGLYVLDELKEPATAVAAASVDLLSFRLSLSSSFYLRHSHLGHVSSSRLKFWQP